MSKPFCRQNLASKPPKFNVLIACEGEKTEVGYFGGIRQSLRVSKERIQIVRHKTDPLSVVEAAIDHRRKLEADRAWAVFTVKGTSKNTDVLENSTSGGRLLACLGC